MTKQEAQSIKRIQAALKDPFQVVYLSENELKIYVQIKNQLEAVFELG